MSFEFCKKICILKRFVIVNPYGLEWGKGPQ